MHNSIFTLIMSIKEVNVRQHPIMNNVKTNHVAKSQYFRMNLKLLQFKKNIHINSKCTNCLTNSSRLKHFFKILLIATWLTFISEEFNLHRPLNNISNLVNSNIK